MSGAANLLSGFLDGMAKGKMLKQQRATQMDELDYKKRLLKNQEDSLKLKQEADQKKQDLITRLLGNLGGGQVPQGPTPQQQVAPPVLEQQGPPAPGRPLIPGQPGAGPGLADKLASGQIQKELAPAMKQQDSIASMPWGQAAALEELTGIDLIGAKRGIESQKTTDINMQRLEFEKQKGQLQPAMNEKGDLVYANFVPGQEPKYTNIRVPKEDPIANAYYTSLLNTQLPKMEEEAKGAYSHLATIDQALDIVKKRGNDVAGWSGKLRRVLAPAASFVGLDIGSLNDAQILENLLSKEAGSLRMEVIGPGPVSEYEQKVLHKVSGKEMSAAEGIQRILEANRRGKVDMIESWNNKITGFQKNEKLGPYIKGVYEPIDYKKVAEEMSNLPPLPPGFKVVQ